MYVDDSPYLTVAVTVTGLICHSLVPTSPAGSGIRVRSASSIHIWQIMQRLRLFKMPPIYQKINSAYLFTTSWCRNQSLQPTYPHSASTSCLPQPSYSHHLWTKTGILCSGPISKDRCTECTLEKKTGKEFWLPNQAFIKKDMQFYAGNPFA